MRAQLEIQFNWIFVLIAGGVILIMFFGVTRSLQQGSEAQVQVDVSSDLRTTLVGVKVGRSSTTIPVPPVGLTLDCDGLKVGTTQGLLLGPTFGPRRLRGTSIMAWSHDWDIPMRVENFLYLSSPQVKYIFIRNPGAEFLVDELVGSLPPIDTEVVDSCEDLDALNPSSQFDLHVIQFDMRGSDEDPALPDASPVDDLCAIPKKFYSQNREVVETYIQPDTSAPADLEEAMHAGYVFLRDQDGFLVHSAYLGDATVYGALFSAGPQLFSCMNVKAFENAGIVLENTKRRLETIFNEGLPAGSSCLDAYQSILTNELVHLQDDIDGLLAGQDIPAQTVFQDRDALERQNSQLQFLSCPTIY